MSNTGAAVVDINSPSIAITDITVKESKSLASVDLLIGEDVHQTQWRKNDHALQTTLDPSQLAYPQSLMESGK
jgi:hypothetical protein